MQKQAMIFAAGLGTRMRPLTDNCPKALIKVRGITLLEHTIRRLKKAGFEDIILNAHYLAHQIEAFLEEQKNFGLRIQISKEIELLDTGGGLKKAFPLLPYPDSPLLIHNTDVMSSLDFDAFWQAHSLRPSLATMWVQDRNSKRKLLFSSQNHSLCGKLNDTQYTWAKPFEPHYSRAFNGIHIVSPAIRDYFPTTPNFSIIDTYLSAAAQGAFLYPYEPIIPTDWVDVGNPQAIQLAEQIFR